MLTEWCYEESISDEPLLAWTHHAPSLPYQAFTRSATWFPPCLSSSTPRESSGIPSLTAAWDAAVCSGLRVADTQGEERRKPAPSKLTRWSSTFPPAAVFSSLLWSPEISNVHTNKLGSLRLSFRDTEAPGTLKSESRPYLALPVVLACSRSVPLHVVRPGAFRKSPLSLGSTRIRHGPPRPICPTLGHPLPYHLSSLRTPTAPPSKTPHCLRGYLRSRQGKSGSPRILSLSRVPATAAMQKGKLLDS